MPVLLWTDDRDAEHRFDLKDRTTVGRLAENDLVLPDNLVSRKHCVFERRGDAWWIVDLGSRFGTFLNDERVEGERKLEAGARIRIGNTPARFMDDVLAISPFSVDPEESTGAGPGKARVATAVVRMSTAKELADQVLRFIENPSSDRRATIEAAKEVISRIEGAERALADLERNKVLGQTLAEVGHLMTMVTQVDDVLQMTLEQAVRALGADRGILLMKDDAGALVARVRRNMSGDPRGISQSIAEKVVETGEPILTTDAQVDPRFMESESVVAHGIHSVMCVPLRGSDQRVFGAIFVDGRPGNPMFALEGVEFLRGFASQAAFAIERAQLATRHKLEEQNRQRLSGFFSPAVIEDILRGSETEALGGKSREITVLFTDIRGFTTLMEKLRPAEAVEMLDDYFTVLVDDLLAEDATLDKFTGDGIMAFFGAPKTQADHALRAVRAALRMQSRIPAMLERWAKEKRSFAAAAAGLATGIGIHTGEAVVGRIGSPRKKDYTAIGDTVNVAARVQGVAEGGDVLITGATLERIRDAVRVAALAPVPLKGKTKAVEIHRVLSMV